MKITYKQNPLDTVVELEDHEIELLRLKIKLEQYEDMLFSAHFALTSRLKQMSSLPPLTLEAAVGEAKKELDPDYWCSDDPTKLDTRVEELLQHYILELQLNHCGDCTCVPSSCSKCHAEEKIGINTLSPFPGKHALHKIASAFSRWNPETQQHDLPEVTIDQVLEKLSNYNPIKGEGWAKFSQESFDAYVPRWTAEAKAAHDWLLNYRNTHLPKE